MIGKIQSNFSTYSNRQAKSTQNQVNFKGLKLNTNEETRSVIENGANSVSLYANDVEYRNALYEAMKKMDELLKKYAPGTNAILSANKTKDGDYFDISGSKFREKLQTLAEEKLDPKHDYIGSLVSKLERRLRANKFAKYDDAFEEFLPHITYY